MKESPRRIVSLVPSLTEALFSLGMGERVVGVTDWCVHPEQEVAALPKVGGTKNPSLARIRELAPDLVIANREENRERDVETLRSEGFEVWVTYPRTVADGVSLLRVDRLRVVTTKSTKSTKEEQPRRSLAGAPGVDALFA